VKENSGLPFWWNGQKNGILFQNNDYVHGASVFVTILFKWPFSKYVWHSYAISLLLNVKFCSIKKLNVLSYFFSPRFLSMFVCQICHGRTNCGTDKVYLLWWLGQLDFLQGSQYTYYLWLGLKPTIHTQYYCQ